MSTTNTRDAGSSIDPETTVEPVRAGVRAQPRGTLLDFIKKLDRKVAAGPDVDCDEEAHR